MGDFTRIHHRWVEARPDNQPRMACFSEQRPV
jgi:hypothetical protein